MKKLLTVLSAFVFCLSLSVAHAQTVTDNDFTLTLPDDWSIVMHKAEQGSSVLFVHEAASHTLLGIMTNIDSMTAQEVADVTTKNMSDQGWEITEKTTQEKSAVFTCKNMVKNIAGRLYFTSNGQKSSVVSINVPLTNPEQIQKAIALLQEHFVAKDTTLFPVRY